MLKTTFANNSVFLRADKHSEFGKAFNALEMLNIKIKSIHFPYDMYADFDTKYYHRYSDEIINKLWNKLTNAYAFEKLPLSYKAGRFYTVIDNVEIIIPKETCEYHESYVTIECELEPQ